MSGIQNFDRRHVSKPIDSILTGFGVRGFKISWGLRRFRFEVFETSVPGTSQTSFKCVEGFTVIQFWLRVVLLS